MRKSLMILLILAGCGSGKNESNQAAPVEQPPSALTQTEQARLEGLIRQALPAVLPDALTAVYRNVKAGAGGSVCGEVASAQANGAPGAFRHFVIRPDASAVLGQGPVIAFDDPEDPLADAWMRWCATPEELQSLKPTLDNAAAATANAAALLEAEAIETPLPAAPLPPPVQEPVPQPEPKAKAPSATPPRETPPPPPQIDSFFNSVQRKHG
jgi:hypothetical protein